MSKKIAIYHSLASYVFPKELVNHFTIEDIRKDPDATLHIHLDEKNIPPAEVVDMELFPNGFYPEALVRDFPLRDRKVLLHVRRRRWMDTEGKSYSTAWDLTAKGTRYSNEFASFLKEVFGYDACSDPKP